MYSHLSKAKNVIPLLLACFLDKTGIVSTDNYTVMSLRDTGTINSKGKLYTSSHSFPLISLLPGQDKHHRH